MEREAFRQFSLYILELLSAKAEGVQVASNLVRRTHAFQDYATSLIRVADAPLWNDSSRLRFCSRWGHTQRAKKQK